MTGDRQTTHHHHSPSYLRGRDGQAREVVVVPPNHGLLKHLYLDSDPTLLLLYFRTITSPFFHFTTMASLTRIALRGPTSAARVARSLQLRTYASASSTSGLKVSEIPYSPGLLFNG